MERTLRLLFTAGRMSQTLELVQDVKNTRTLSLLQPKLYFPKYPGNTQQVITKSSPEGATYYVSWTKGDKTYRLNLSNPQAGPVPGRAGDLGGFAQLKEADKAHLPDGFVACGASIVAFRDRGVLGRGGELRREPGANEAGRGAELLRSEMVCGRCSRW